MHRWKRRRVFVDPQLQGHLCARVAMYWLCCLSTVALLLGCWMVLRKTPASAESWFADIWFSYGPALLTSLFVLPLVLLDCLVISNKFVGPLRRLKVGMTDLANGKPVEPIRLRRGDFCGDLALQFNRIVDRVHAMESDSARATTLESPSTSDVEQTHATV